MDFNANHSKLKHLEVELRNHESSDVTPRTIHFGPFNDQIDQITHLEKKVIFLESDKSIWHILFMRKM